MDIDGVIADFESSLLSAISANFGPQIAELNRHLYSFADRYKGLPEVCKFVDDFVNNRHSYHSLQPIEDGVRFVWELRDRNIPVFFATSRPESSKVHTESWLKRNLGYFYLEDFHVSANKAKWICENFIPDQVAFIVDDNPDVCEYLNGARFLCFAWRQPWNENVFPAIVPTRDAFYVVGNEADEGVDLFAEIEALDG